MRKQSGGICRGRIPRRRSMLWAAAIATATLTIATLVMTGLVPGWHSHASSIGMADGDPNPETTPAQTAADADHTYADLLAQGDAFGLQGDFATAIRYDTRAIKLEPQRAEGYAKRATALYNSGAAEKALADYNQAIAYTPSDAELYLSRAMVQLSCKRADLAFEDCDKAVRLSPQLVKARLFRANAHLGRGEFDAAIDDYNSILATTPTFASAYCNRGVAYRSKGDVDRAIADYTSAIRYNTRFADAYNNRGEIYLRQGKYDQALADFNEALRIEPAHSNSYDNRGDLYLLLGKPELAIADYTEIIDRALQVAAKSNNLHPAARLANVYLKRASAHLKADQAKEAIIDVGEAVRIDPEDAQAYAIRRDAYLKLGQTELAGTDDDLAKRLERLKSRHAPAP